LNTKELISILLQKSAERVRNMLNINEMGMQKSSLTIFFVFRELRTLWEHSLEERAEYSHPEGLRGFAYGGDIFGKHEGF
jgi:hypothetical protein